MAEEETGGRWARLERMQHPDPACKRMPHEGLNYILKEMGHHKGSFYHRDNKIKFVFREVSILAVRGITL